MERLRGETLSEHYRKVMISLTKAQNFKGRKMSYEVQRLYEIIIHLTDK